MKTYIINAFRFIFALVFIFSGFVKGIDPLGFTYKIEDYLIAFGPQFETIIFLAFPTAVFLCALEFIIGFNLLLGIYKKRTSILGLIFMGIMTPLTLYIAIYNPVTDCGCFGDALVISNWVTFYKNIGLSAIIVVLFFYRQEIKPLYSHNTRWIMSLYGFLFMIILSLYCYTHLPIVDFRPYKIGTHIPDGMIIPENATRDVYNTTFIYKKNGEEKEFTLENYPANDTTWKFVDQKSKLISKGYEPPIHDFSINLPFEGDITEEILADSNYTFLLIAHKLEKSSTKNTEKINQIYNYARENGYKFYCLNSSLNEDIQDYIEETNAQYPMATTDNITLKTIIRSNPGLVLLKSGTILNKWHNNNLPVFEKPLHESTLGKIQKPNYFENILFTIALFIIPLLITGGFDKLFKKNKK